MKSHRPIVGALHLAWGLLSLLPVVILAVVFGGVWGAVTAATASQPDGALAGTLLGVGLGVVLLVVLCAVALVGLLSVAAGLGVLQGRRWGDVLAAIASALHVFSVPFGTALAVYTGWALFVREPAPQSGLPVREPGPAPLG